MASITWQSVYFRVALIFVSACLAGCASIGGYPTNPYNSEADLAAFVANSGPDAIQIYYDTLPTSRELVRNRIVYSRIAAYDIEYQTFQANLLKESNLETVSADMIVLGLNGAGATAGGAALKATLAAASAGVVGAKASINKELFFDRAMPAILAQMAASRSAQFSVIQKGLQLSDAEYPLPKALIDANSYREAGSLPTAINLLTANATAARTDIKETETINKVGPIIGVPSTAPSSRNFSSPTFAPGPSRSPGLTFTAPSGSSTFFRNLP